jgi:site-specific DNA-methyltransferase (adenine-specific)
VHFVSGRQDWCTPGWLFEALDAEFAFELDAAASSSNALCARFLSEADDALVAPWGARAVFVNPPYSKLRGGIGAWMAKARREAEAGATVVLLVPARMDAGWWLEHVLEADEVWFIGGRLRFVGATDPAPFPSAIVIFRPPVRRPGPRGSSYVLRPVSRPAFSYLLREPS